MRPSSFVDMNTFIVFGGTGDLMQRKLLPALFKLQADGQVPRGSPVVAVARNAQMTEEQFRVWARGALEEFGVQDEQMGQWCDECLYYQPVTEGRPEEFEQLAARIALIEESHGVSGNRTIYLALPPASFAPAIEGLSSAGLNRSSGWTRLVIEKPFGRDFESAQALNRTIHNHFQESQVYRIDHYLGKETVQNLLVFRFSNPIFEAVWNRQHIESIELTIAEDLGIERRAGYYARSGALRDMVQNHLTQVLTLIAMEVPATFDADSIRDEKLKVLRSLAPLDHREVVLGQYAPGSHSDTNPASYLEEPGIPSGSTTETFAALRMKIANWRWQGVPFQVRTGKRLPRRLTRIVAHFRCPPVALFQPYDSCALNANSLTITLQPDEGFDLGFQREVS